MENARAFAHGADAYARHRPRYPKSLFAWLADQSPGRERAWDCASGNGQAALGSAEHFDQVFATDFSLEQMRQGFRHPRVHFAAAAAEAPPFPAESFDLITVALAVHWFDLPRFFAAVDRVLHPGGLLAVWGYAFPGLSPRLDALIQRHLLSVIAPFWSERNHLVANRYRDLTLPYPLVPVPPLEDITLQWTRGQLLAHFSTWSAVRRCRDESGHDPLPPLDAALRPHWPEGEKRTVTLPLFVKAARKPANPIL